jgi:hypothetical protein
MESGGWREDGLAGRHGDRSTVRHPRDLLQHATTARSVGLTGWPGVQDSGQPVSMLGTRYDDIGATERHRCVV